MDRLIRYAACAANAVMIVTAIVIFANAYGSQKFLALLLAIPPALSLFALCSGPDKEERLLQRQVSKARLRRELQELEGKK